jgi:HEAT repeat protein
VRYYACQALGRSKATDIEKQLLPLVGDRAGQVRVAAIEALAQLGSPAAIQALREFVDHEDLDLRRAALVGLGLAADHSSLPVLLAAASAGDATTRLVALSALTRFPDERVVALWLESARSGAEPLRVAAINLLAERPGLPAASGLVQLLLETGESNLMVSALAKDLEGRVSALENGLSRADDDQARVLVTCLVRSSAEDAQRAIYRGAVSPSAAVRRAVASALSGLNTPEARALLAEVAASDADAEVRSISHLHLESL